MPTKRRTYESDSEDDNPRKTAKTSTHFQNPGKGKSASTDSVAKTDDNGETYFELSGKRRVTVSSFKGKMMVSVREFYEKDGQTLPGKKGISMSMEQYNTFVKLMPNIEAVLTNKGEKVVRPDYNAAMTAPKAIEPEAEDDADGGEDPDSMVAEKPLKKTRKSKATRKNIEATSEEDSE